jgi:hypothetical protein
MRGGNYQGKAVGISRTTGGIPRPSGGDIEVNWWGYQGQLVGKLLGQGQRGGASRSR